MAKKKAMKQVAPDKEGMPDAKSVEKTLLGAGRKHVESLGAAWIAVSGLPPAELIPRVIPTVLSEGGTRNSWRWSDSDLEYVLMAWPKISGLRAAVLMRGPAGGALKPVSCVPLLEGLPNALTIETVHPWEEGCGATVGCDILGPEQPLWFYDPFYVRDRNDLTPGVTQSVLLGALAFGVRRALLDEITITRGPTFEAHAAKWLEEHPDKTRLDVPPLAINVAGKHVIHPGNTFGEYQMRAVVTDIDTCEIAAMPITILYTAFPMEGREPLRIPLYVAKINLGSYTPKVGDDIDAYVWFQGRILDWDDSAETVEPTQHEAGESGA